MAQLVGALEMQPFSWIVASVLMFAFILSMTMGANDVANAFGTSVGAKVLTLRQACMVAAVFNLLGSVLLGKSVTKTIGTGLVHMDDYTAHPEHFMLGMLCAEIGAFMLVGLATKFSLPVSTSHAVVGAVVGFGLVQDGLGGIVWWPGLGRVMVSWVTSPLFAGILAAAAYWVTLKTVLRQQTSLALQRQRLLLSCVIAIVAVLLVVFISYEENDGAGLWAWLNLILALLIGAVVLGISMKWLVPFIIDRYHSKQVATTDTTTFTYNDIEEANLDISMETQRAQEGSVAVDEDYEGGTKKPAQNGRPSSPSDSAPDESTPIHENAEQFDPSVEERFSAAQVLTASFMSFSHGSNDVSNAAGPLVAVWSTYVAGQLNSSAAIPTWILIYGGAGIVLGLLLWGQSVIETLGHNMTKITPSRGYCVELGTASAVLVASFIGVPVSTTQCAVGAIVAVGLMNAQRTKSVNVRLIGKIIVSWLVTIPIAAAISAIFYAALRPTVDAQAAANYSSYYCA